MDTVVRGQRICPSVSLRRKHSEIPTKQERQNLEGTMIWRTLPAAPARAEVERPGRPFPGD